MVIDTGILDLFDQSEALSLCLKIRACVYNNDVCVSVIRTLQITVRYFYFFFLENASIRK